VRIIKEYEALLEPQGLRGGCGLEFHADGDFVLEDSRRPTLLARLSGTSLTTAIVREGVLAGISVHGASHDGGGNYAAFAAGGSLSAGGRITRDTWQEGIQAVRVAGLRRRLPEFVKPLQDEFKCDVARY